MFRHSCKFCSILNISRPFKCVLRGLYISVGIVLNEIGHILGHFTISSHFNLKNGLKFKKIWKFEWDKSIFLSYYYNSCR